MSNRHYDPPSSAPSWAKKCKHCDGPMKTHIGKFGSNACRQAAYRSRRKLAVTDFQAEKSVTHEKYASAQLRVGRRIVRRVKGGVA